MILHLDMDAFFASVEQLENPELRGIPVIIGGRERGVVATASYEARVYGIHSAMPVATARKLCPHGVFLHGRHRHYSEISAKIIKILHGFSPLVQKASIDEAYLDLSGLPWVKDNPVHAGRRIKEAVYTATGGLTCSLGIAPVKFLAKICSDMDKPNGLFILNASQMDDFLIGLPVAKLPGVGKHMQQKLLECGVRAVGDLRRLSRPFLVERFGKWGAVLHDRAHGIDARQVHENLPAKSEGSENTFSRDTRNRRELDQALLHHADRVASALRKASLAGRTITMKIKFENFEQISRSRTLPYRTNRTRTIYTIAAQLLNAIELRQAVRLIGITVSGFEPRPEQLSLPGLNFPELALSEDLPEKNDVATQKIDILLDQVRAKFGNSSIRLAGTAPQNESCHHFEKRSGNAGKAI